jgi:hypothetical protein
MYVVFIFSRRAAIDWLRKQFKDKNPSSANGVVYFADDDNTYDSEIFRQVSISMSSNY